MHRIFGQRRNGVPYRHRMGAYLFPIRGNLVGVAKTLSGYFPLGGGIDPEETDEQCIVRECMEETGYRATVDTFVCTAETYGFEYSNHPTIQYFHPICAYYLGEMHEQVQCPTEPDHELAWVPYEKLRGNMYNEMQNWALEQCWCTAKQQEAGHVPHSHR